MRDDLWITTGPITSPTPTLTVRVRDARTSRIVASARTTFARAGQRAVVVRGKRLPRKTVVEVRFRR